MAVERAIQVLKRSGGELATQMISNVNPLATATVLKNFCQQTMALTTNTYVDAYIIDKESVNEAAAAEEEGGQDG